MENNQPQLGTTEYSQQLVNRARSLGVTGAGVDSLSAAVSTPKTQKAPQTTYEAEKIANNSGSAVIPSIPPSTLAEGMTGKATAFTELYNQEQAKLSAATEAVNADDTAITDSFKKIEDIYGSRGKMEEESNVAGLKETARNAANRLVVSQRAQTNELRAIQNDPSVSLDVKQQMNASVNRKYAFEQADLQLSYHLANSDFNSATEIINDKIKLSLEPEMRKLDMLKFFSEKNRDIMTKADDRAFAIKEAEITNEIKTKENNLNNIYNIQLELAKIGKSVPSSIMSQYSDGSKDASSLLSDLGRAGISLTAPKAPQDPLIKTINGVDMEYNRATGKWETIKTQGDSGDTLKLAQAKSNIDNISTIVSDKNIRTAVGPTKLARFIGAGWDRLTGGRQNFIASVEQVREQLTLDKLSQAKASGATFGALSDGERITLSAAATKIGSWAKKDDDGRVVAYVANEKDFKKEFDTINNFAKLDYVLRGGSPEDVGITEMPDGSLVTQNSDGSITVLR